MQYIYCKGYIVVRKTKSKGHICHYSVLQIFIAYCQKNPTDYVMVAMLNSV